MALEQLNLKLPPAVLAHWRAQAQAQGLSVRDWLVSITAPPAGPEAGPPGRAALADRLAQLERSTVDLAAAVAQLQAQGPAPRSQRPASPPIPRTGDAPSPERVSPAPRSGDEPSPAGAIPTAELAQRLGMKRGSLNERIRRMGGAREGLEVEGWRCCGQAPALGGGPLRWLWVPVGG